MNLKIKIRMALWFSLLVPAGAFATTYYVDCKRGSDTNNGTSTSTAWKTIARVNLNTYLPGDSILLKRGCVWSEPGFKAQGNGTVASPITLADYGAGALPEINGVGDHEAAVLLENVQYWTVRNLDLTQTGQSPQALCFDSSNDCDVRSDEYMRAVVHVLGLGGPAGVQTCGDPGTACHIRLENLKVHDGSWNGIYVSGGFYQLNTGVFGYVEDVVVTEVESWNHHKSGIQMTCTYYKTRIYATKNIQVLDSNLHDNGGDGAMIGPVQNGLLDGNNCAYNGRLRNARVGCWTWDSLNTTIQFSESHHNMTPLTSDRARDGGGFDLDLGTEDGMIQYNWSHDNEGEGFLLLTYPIHYGYSRGITHNAQMRYNIGERDGKKLAGGITVFGGVAPAVIYNNTIYYEPDRLAGTDMFNGEGGALTTSVYGQSGKPDLRTYNNIFITNGTVNSQAVNNNVWSDGAGTFTFNHNLWWRVEGGVRYAWGSKVITTWSGWQKLGFDPNGLNADPLVFGPLGAGPSAYQLSPGSPAIDAGQLVTDALRGTGTRDYFGTPIPQGCCYDIGAAEKP